MSRNAAIGGIRAARRAGNSAASERHREPDDERGDGHGERDDDRARGEVEPERGEPGGQRPRQQRAAGHAGDAGDGPDRGCLDEDRPDHLSPCRADCPEQGELTLSLGDEDGERVVDHERPDEQRQAGEPGQPVLQDVEELADPAPQVGDVLLAGDGLEFAGGGDVGGHDGADAVTEDVGRDARIGEYEEPARFCGVGHERGRDRRGEQRPTGTTARGFAEGHGADEAVRGDRRRGADRDGVADAELAGLGGCAIEHDLVVGLRCAAAPGEGVGVHRRHGGVLRGQERDTGPEGHGLTVAPDDHDAATRSGAPSAPRRPRRRPRPRSRAPPARCAGRRPRSAVVAALLTVAPVVAGRDPDHDVDAIADGREQRVERGPGRVAEDPHAGHERHTQHDRDERADQAAGVAAQAAECDANHPARCRSNQSSDRCHAAAPRVRGTSRVRHS
ncbi:MAG: hypothetical protein V9G12_23905 [Microthrixaceae bacterium]